MNENMQKLLNFLSDKMARHEYISSHELSDFMNISSRQVRKYITKINDEIGSPIITSSYKGYHLDIDAYYQYKTLMNESSIENPKTRRVYIIQKLIRYKEGYDIFDLSEELYVSIPTIESDLKGIRHLLSTFDISIKRDHNIIYLDSTEKNKRLLMQHLLSSDNYNHFLLKEQVQLLTYHYHHQDLYSIIKDIYLQNNMFANDYTLNNTVIHLIIMIDRIRSGCNINDSISMEKFIGKTQYNIALQIKKYVELNFHISVNDAELYDLMLIILNNTTEINYSSINITNIHNYIEQKYIQIATEMIQNVEKFYCLEPFDDGFIVKFTIHIKNMFQRLQNQYYAKNPLSKMMKHTYPLIYDIAVFMALEFKKLYGIHLNEDEIAFLAFHIGAYFENHNQRKINCIFVYVNYYSIHQNILDKIINNFSDQINIKAAMSIHDYQSNHVQADLILSMADLQFDIDYVVIHPILTENDYQNIFRKITSIKNKKYHSLLKQNLLSLSNEELFYKNVSFKNREEAIKIMSQNIIERDLAYENLYQTTIAREYMSSTAFGNVAIPHSLSHNTKQTFISVAICEKPILWSNDHYIQLIVFIGFGKESRNLFSDIFQELIKILSNPSHIKKLITCQSFHEFIELIISLIDNC